MKKNLKSYTASLIFFFILLVFIAWIWFPNLISSRLLYSPLPSFLNLKTNPQTATLDLWLPRLLGQFQQFGKPDITAKSALLFDIDSQRFLFEKDSAVKLPMASLTKVMTAIVGLEHKRTDDRYLVHQQDLVGEDVMGLEKGEVLTLEELLYGLILHSGNDAAEVIASNFGGGREQFIKAMNDKAVSLGLKNTHFTNPTGLEGDGSQYTTAYDLLVMSQYAISHFPFFDEVAKTFDYTIPQTATHKAYYLENETNLLTSYEGVKGIKTGYTPEAGLCLITYLDYNSHHFIGVLLGSENRRGEMKTLLDYGLKTEGVTPPKS